MEPKRIVLTGASRGLGRAMAERFIADGHTVCGCARNAAAMTEMAARRPDPHSFEVVGVADVPLSPGVIDTDMLRTCWGDDASSYPSPDEWAKRAVPFLLALGPKDNGKQLTVPE